MQEQNTVRICVVAFAVVAFVGCGSPSNSPAVSGEESTHETVKPASPEDLAISASIANMGFQVPAYSQVERQAILSQYAYVDPLATIPQKLRDAAVTYYNANLSKIKNKTYLTVVDFTLHSSVARFFIINMNTGSVTAFHVAHGSGSDPNNTGYATLFSNVDGSEKSSLGYYMTAETYTGVHGYSLRIDGLSSTNSNVRVRDIVIHGASYVYDSNVQAGRSWGCFALPMDDRTNVVNMLQGGSLMYADLE